MNQFVLCHNNAAELRLFPHILQIGVIKNTAIHLNGFPSTAEEGLKIYYIQEGKFQWCIRERYYTLYPGDVAMILPGTSFGNANAVLEVGAFSWIHIQLEKSSNTKFIKGTWSSLSQSENDTLSGILLSGHTPVLHQFNEAGTLLKTIQSELFNQEIGYQTRVNHLLDEILIQTTRQFTKISNSGRDFPTTFIQLEQELRRNLSHQWTVEEMAAITGLGTTLFNEKVKSYSGFSPLSYLINIRIAEAIKLLKKPDISLTDIALDTGFYSSQHFSTTFKKLTGYTPSDFRKNHLRTN